MWCIWYFIKIFYFFVLVYGLFFVVLFLWLKNKVYFVIGNMVILRFLIMFFNIYIFIDIFVNFRYILFGLVFI